MAARSWSELDAGHPGRNGHGLRAETQLSGFRRTETGQAVRREKKGLRGKILLQKRKEKGGQSPSESPQGTLKDREDRSEDIENAQTGAQGIEKPQERRQGRPDSQGITEERQNCSEGSEDISKRCENRPEEFRDIQKRPQSCTEKY
ncbi:MAG: hypothetical protein Q4B25_02955 [Pseudomonadota bacterium]|nr:hypothetical protein [Pseudomonadota bacterium]